MLTATDKGTIRIVVVAVAILALSCVGGVIALSIAEVKVPSILETLAVASLTGLVGLLSSTRSGAGGQEAAAAAVMAQGIAQPLPQPGSTTGQPITVILPEAVQTPTVPEEQLHDITGQVTGYDVPPAPVVQPTQAQTETSTYVPPPA
jgi:hypothetical protein